MKFWFCSLPLQSFINNLRFKSYALGDDIVQKSIPEKEMTTDIRSFNYLLKRIELSSAETPSGLVVVDIVKAAMRDGDSRIRADAIKIGIANDIASFGDIDRALGDRYVEVRLAAIFPAIKGGLATLEQVEALFSGKGSTSDLDVKMEVRAGLFGFYHDRTVRAKSLQDAARMEIASAIRKGEAPVEQVARALCSNDFRLIKEATSALVDFYRTHAYYALAEMSARQD